MNFNHLSEENLNIFRKIFSEDQTLQNLKFEDLYSYSVGKAINGGNAQTASASDMGSRFPRNLPVPTNCQMAIGGVVVDCLLAIIGGIGLHGKISASSIEEVIQIIEPEISQIEEIARVLGRADSGVTDKAKAIFRIGKLVYSGGMLEAIYKAIMQSLTWWDMILYGVIGLAELTAAFLTDGAALIVEFVAEIATVGFIVSDAFKVQQECGASQTTQRAPILSENLVILEGYDPLAKKLALYIGKPWGFEQDGLMISTTMHSKFNIVTGSGRIVRSGDNFKLKCVPPASIISIGSGPGAIHEVLDTLNNPGSYKPYFVDDKYITTLLTINLANKLSSETNIQDGDRVNIISSKDPNLYLGFFGKPAPYLSEVVFSAVPFEWVIRKTLAD